ncbi:subtilase-type protease inhibitor (plasmid) [Embleya sp. NBC_00888]|uniref:SSI family serine proteinase inhibitor n=1 Tax=Embleya sp. NBC_00888 TaxID=2975960 RepID=UPI002F90C7D0|nr:subtilase-type protease inhibitor [Embleya sp. NBC_00888]
MLIRRLVVAAAAVVAVQCPIPSAVAATVDHLTVTVADNPEGVITYTLACHPAGGSHPEPQAACARLDATTTGGRDPFAPVPAGAHCTMIYGGPATARISGTWAGRSIDATFKRVDGCEISRWDNLVPVLPQAR